MSTLNSVWGASGAGDRGSPRRERGKMYKAEAIKINGRPAADADAGQRRAVRRLKKVAGAHF